MKFIVCIKQVPSTNEVRLDPVTHAIIRDGRQSVINPFDLYAVELGAQLRDRMGGTLTALSMGIPATERLLRECISRGADDAVLMTDRAFAGSDTLATSYAISLGVDAVGGADLILCGKMAVDGDTAQIGPELARTLGIHHVTDVAEVMDITEKNITVRKVTESGSFVEKVAFPAVITVVKDIVMPRLPSISGVRKSLTAPFKTFSAAEANADTARTGFNGSPTSVVKTFTPEGRTEAAPVEGTPADQAAFLLQAVKEVR